MTNDARSPGVYKQFHDLRKRRRSGRGGTEKEVEKIRNYKSHAPRIAPEERRGAIKNGEARFSPREYK